MRPEASRPAPSDRGWLRPLQGPALAVSLWLAVAAGLAGCATGPGGRSEARACCSTKALPASGVFHPGVLLDPALRWTSDAGLEMSLSSLKGHPLVVAFFFADCHVICPFTVEKMRGVEAALTPREREQTRFVLISIIPEQDTPAALAHYRREHGLNPQRWTLLNGGRQAVARAAQALGVEVGRDRAGRTVHGSEITLIDPSGAVKAQASAINGDWDLFMSQLHQLEVVAVPR